MSQDVYVLWFKNADINSRNDYHWSFFIAPTGSTRGVKYDAFSTSAMTGVLEWSYSHVPNYEMGQSVNLGAPTILGTIGDVEGFKTLMLSIPLPNTGENCQTWIKNVVDGAVKQGRLPASAIGQIGTIPVRP
jgi:hypothetical protein